MAIVTTSVTPTGEPQVFDTTPGVRQNGAPRAQINFNQNFASTGVGASDVEELKISLVLPINYYYRPLSLSVMLYAASSAIAVAWPEDARVSVITGNEATRYFMLGVSSVELWANSNGNMREWRLETQGDQASFGQLVDGREGTSAVKVPPEFKIELYSASNSIAAGNFNVSGTFLQYDVSQGLNWPLFYSGNALSV